MAWSPELYSAAGAEERLGRWTLDDVPWEQFDRAKVDPELVRIVKAASLVEYNGASYASHLCRVFADDAVFQDSARHWGDEEVQHGAALARWAALADPGFDFAAAVARFRAGYQINFDIATSRRGSLGAAAIRMPERRSRTPISHSSRPT